MSEQTPGTIGALIRQIRERVVPHVTIRELARRSGVNPDYLGKIERDNVPGRDGKPVSVAPAKIAQVLAALPLTDEDRSLVRQIAPKVADALDAPPSDAGQQGASGDSRRPVLALVPDELGDELVEAWIERPDVPDHDRRVLRMLWRQTDPEGKLLPRDTRVRALVDWRQNYMANAGGRAAGAPSEARDAPGNAS